MDEAEYKKEWLEGKHPSEYNDCRFSDDKVNYCIDWLNKKIPHWNEYDNIVREVCRQKIKIAKDNDYRELCQKYADKVEVMNYIDDNLIIPTTVVNNLDTFEGSQNTIMKCNHGSGWNVKLNGPLTDYNRNQLKEWLNLNYAYISGYEAQYEKIRPLVISQPKLTDVPIDWGFWCVNGNVEGVSLTKKFGKNLEQYLGFVDKNGKFNRWYIGCRPIMDDLPKSWMNKFNELKEIAETYSKQFDFVRVDLYYVQKPYFGELTFTPCSGVLTIKEN